MFSKILYFLPLAILIGCSTYQKTASLSKVFKRQMNVESFKRDVASKPALVNNCPNLAGHYICTDHTNEIVISQQRATDRVEFTMDFDSKEDGVQGYVVVVDGKYRELGQKGHGAFCARGTLHTVRYFGNDDGSFDVISYYPTSSDSFSVGGLYYGPSSKSFESSHGHCSRVRVE